MPEDGPCADNDEEEEGFHTPTRSSTSDEEENDEEARGSEEEETLESALQQSVNDMISVPGTNAGDLFFELYRTVLYLYSNDLRKKRHLQVEAKRTQSDEDAKGILVENIAVDGQLPSRALRRAVMASSSQINLDSEADDRVDFEEFAHSLAIVMAMLCKREEEDDQDGSGEEVKVEVIGRDVHRSRSQVLKRVHRRARAIVRKDVGAGHGSRKELQVRKYEARIKRLEDQVASLKNLLESAVGDGMKRSDSSRRVSRRVAKGAKGLWGSCPCGPAPSVGGSGRVELSGFENDGIGHGQGHGYAQAGTSGREVCSGVGRECKLKRMDMRSSSSKRKRSSKRSGRLVIGSEAFFRGVGWSKKVE